MGEALDLPSGCIGVTQALCSTGRKGLGVGTGGDRGVVKAGRSPGEPGKPSQRRWHAIWSVFTGWGGWVEFGGKSSKGY